MQVQTMDAFFGNGIIDDALIYLEHIPDNYISGKEELIRELKERREATAAEMSTMPKGMSTGEIPMSTGGNPEPIGQLSAALSNI